MYQGKYVNQAERPANLPQRRPPRPRKKEVSDKTRLFYRIYGISAGAILAIFLILLIPLNSWLVGYEASQPHAAADKVFREMFVAKDWKGVYEAAGVADSKFENADSFVAFMNAKIGDNALSCLETSAGLSGDRKYVIRLGDEKLVTYTLAMTGNENNVEWQLADVDLSELQSVSVNVTKLPGHTVYVNGVALDASYTVRTISTLAEEYLPAGATGYNAEQQRVSGLFAAPTVTAKDAAGKDVSVTFDAASGFYSTITADTAPITDAENNLAVNAAKANGKFMIRAINKTDLATVFDASSKIYKSLVEADSFVQGYTSYNFENMTVSDLYRYSDKLFSVRVTMTLSVNRSAGGIKTFPMDNTYFFTKNASGKWMVTNMVNGNAQDKVEKVRLTFTSGGMSLSSILVSPTATKLTPPAVTAPEGQVFAGWAQEVKNANGSTTMRIVFTPDESGSIHLTGETKLEPMTLVAVFKTPDGAQ